jgi:hypothetical protein
MQQFAVGYLVGIYRSWDCSSARPEPFANAQDRLRVSEVEGREGSANASLP